MEGEEGEGAVGHGGLDGLDARGGGVFAGFGVVVEEVGRAERVLGVFWVGRVCGGGYRVSSGRDMIEEGCGWSWGIGR